MLYLNRECLKISQLRRWLLISSAFISHLYFIRTFEQYILDFQQILIQGLPVCQ